MMKDLKKFVELVKKMRDAQKSYFGRKSPEKLKHSKELEKQVDKAIDDFNSNQITLNL